MFNYNKLFCYGYKIAEKSRNFDYCEPILPCSQIACCLGFDIASIIFLLEGFGIISSDSFFTEKYLISGMLGIYIFVLLYYYWGKRYVSIVNKYKLTLNLKYKYLYFFGTFILHCLILFISGLFCNRDWIFESIPPIDLF